MQQCVGPPLAYGVHQQSHESHMTLCHTHFHYYNSPCKFLPMFSSKILRLISSALKPQRHLHHASKLEKPTKQQLSEAVNALADTFPEEASNLKQYHDAIVDFLFSSTEPASGSPIFSLKLDIKPTTESVEASSMSPCAAVVADVVFFVLGMLKLHVSKKEKITQALLQRLGQDTIREVTQTISIFNQADGAFAKASALLPIVGGIWRAGGFTAIFNVIKSEMSWWKWTRAVAQLNAWIICPNQSFVDEAALTIMSDKQLIEDAKKCA